LTKNPIMRNIDITGFLKNIKLHNCNGNIKEVAEENTIRKMINMGREAVIVYIIK